MTIHRTRAGAVAVTVAAVAALTLSACSSSSSKSDGSTGAGTGSTGGTGASGSAIKIFVATATDTPGGSFPGLVAGAKAAARSINSSGGINGHKITVVPCNGKLDPNQEVTCAQQAVSSGAAAVVGSIFAANPDAVQKVLQNAGMANFAGAVVSPTQLSSPIQFPLDSGPFIPTACLAMAQAKVATKLATISSDIGPIKANATFAVGAAKTLSIPITKQVTLPAAAPDVTSQVQQVINSKADGIVMFASPSQATQVLQATAQLGAKPAVCSSDGLLTAAQVTQLGAAASNLYIASSMPPLSAASSNPAVANFVKDMKAEVASGDNDASIDAKTYSSTSMRAWAGVQGFAQIAKTITGTVDKTSFLAAVRKATNVTTGIFPPVNFTKPVGGKAFPSLYNAKLDLLKWDTGSKSFVTTKISFDASSITG